VETKLVDALSGGGTGHARVDQFLRLASKKAVATQYEIAKATNRHAAALKGDFEMAENSSRRTASGKCVSTIVRFKVSSRKWEEDEVELLDEEELQALVLYLLQMGDDAVSNNLKPYEMARQSPQVFWSLVNLYGGDLIAGLNTLLPDESFDALDTRVRRASEKGEHNRQQEAQERLEKEQKRLDKESAALKRKETAAARKRQKKGGPDDDNGSNGGAVVVIVLAVVGGAAVVLACKWWRVVVVLF
jgi:hypothetical protein